MKKFGEYGVHAEFMEGLEDAGWNAWGDPDRAGEEHWGGTQMDAECGRDRDEVVYWDVLKEQIVELNPQVDAAAAGEIVESLKRDLSAENLVEGNKAVYKLLRNGKQYTLGPEHDNETIKVRLVAHPDDPDHDYSIDDNRFDAVTEVPVERQGSIRPDIVCYINGIPFVVMELKSTSQDATIKDAISDMRQYEADEPRLFVPALFNAVCDGHDFRYAAVGASESFYFPWYPDDVDAEEALAIEDITRSLFDPETLLDMFRYFVFYEENQAKIVPRHMQYHAANRIVDRIRAGEPRKGLIWHTQGSGKSYTMLFAAYKGKKHPDMDDRQYVLIVDRKKLDEQMADTLAAIDFPAYSVAKHIDHLGNLLGEEKGQLILTTIHKFGGVDDAVKADVDLDTVVMVDEAHRYQEKNLGNKLKGALNIPEEGEENTIDGPPAFYFGFTGTPVAEGTDRQDRNTFQEFSSKEDEGYLHRYSLKEGERDGVITQVTFTLKQIPWEIPDEVAMDLDFEGTFEDLEPEKRRKVLQEYVNRTELSELRPRMEKVVEDIHEHYRKHLAPIGYKGMVVTPSKRAAALYGNELMEYMEEDEVEVVISSGGDDPAEVREHYLSDEEERQIIKRFKDPDENPKLLVVCDKLLTGFDAPILKTLYLDKDMKNHRLLQAIARTNRPRDGKNNGEIVDYAGVFADPETVLEYKDVEFVARAARDTSELADEFIETLDELFTFFDDMDMDGRPSTLKTCVVRLEKHPKVGRKFENLYKDAEELYESVSPHRKLGDDDIKRRWAIISQIYREYRKTEEGGEDVLGDEIRAKTRRILEDHIDFDEIGPGKTVEYDIPEKEVTVVEDTDPEYDLIDAGNRLRHTYEEREDQNPHYSKLSEKVKAVMERWRRDELTASEAMERIQEIQEEEEALQQEQEERDLSDTGFALFELLTGEYSDFVADDAEAEQLAEAISDRVADLTLEGNLAQIKRGIREELINTLVEHDKVELAKHEDKAFLKKATGYIVSNAGE